MSQNKTVIQGLEPAGNTHAAGAPGGPSGSNFYSRGQRQPARGTVVPGMNDTPPMGQPAGQSFSGNAVQQPAPKPSGKPVVGFLYSVSRSAMGEYWPLHIGRNTIGQNPASDIVLGEGTVSTDHAVIVVRQMKQNGTVIAAITDAQSTNGTMVNGESIGFAPVECHNGDIITVGNNYELLLLLIDAARLGLAPCPDFIAAATDDDDYEDDDQGGFFDPFQRGATRPGEGGFNPMNGGFNPNGGGYANGTVGMDGSMPNQSGGTVSM